MAPCKFFALGHCMRGDGCKYEHDTAARNMNTALQPPALRPPLKTNSQFRGPGSNVAHVLTDNWREKQVVQPDHVLQAIDPRSQTPCLHYARGNCRNGDACPYLHPAPVKEDWRAPIQKVEDSRSQIPCHHFIRGHCKNGKACPYLHPEVVEPKEEISPDDEEKLNYDNFTRELCGALAHFQGGAQVFKVSLPADFSAARISGLPDTASQESVCLLLSRVDINITPDCIRISRQTGSTQICADIKVEDPAFVKTLCTKFAVKERLGPELSRIEVTPLPGSISTGTNASRVECKKVQCSWFKPSRTVWLNYGNEDIAQQVFNKFTSKQYKIQSKAVHCNAPTGGGIARGRGWRNPLAWTVMLTDLPVNTTEQNIRDALRAPSDSPRNIELGDPSYDADGELASASVMSLLGQFGPIEWSQANTELEGKRAKAVARFYEEMDAREAARSLDGKPLNFCKSMKLTVQLVSTAKFKVATNIFGAVQANIRAVSQTWKEQHLNFKIYPSAGLGQQYRVLKIEGQLAKDVAGAKVIMDKILDGITVKRNGQPVWTPSLSNNGSAFQKLKKIQEEHGVIVIRNKRKSELRLFGPPEKCSRVELAIAAMVDSESSSARSISLKPEDFQWACSGGFKMIVGAIGEHVAMFDIISTPKRILIEGSEKEYETALRMVKNRMLESKTRKIGTEDCSVCWTQAENPVFTKCGHVYCMECFEGLCTAASSTGKDFSIICQGDMGKCQVVFGLEELQEILSSKAFEEVLEASFASHIQRNPATYSYCPKPDCGMIYRITDTMQVNTCSKCLTVICTYCRASHEGKTCADYKDEISGAYEATKKLKKEMGIKDCPSCGIGMEKTEGCNHMTCGGCGAHVCWVCLEVFKTSGPCYDHMTVKHGGIGLGLDGV